MIVEDTQTDPLWAPWKELAAQYQLRACWSEPILGHGGEVLGTLAMYYREPRSPTEEALALAVETLTNHVIAMAENHNALSIGLQRLAEEVLKLTNKHNALCQEFEHISRLVRKSQ